MESLSVAANIIEVLQAANTIISICCDYSAAVKGASWELPKVTKEVQSLRDVLELLSALAKRAENEDSGADGRLPALKRLCKPDAGPLAMCKAELESLKTKLEPPKWTGPVKSKRTALVQALSWPLKEGETKSMLQNMERYKTTLNMALEMDQTAMSLEIHDMSRVIQAKTSEMSEDFANLKLSLTMAKLDAKLDEWLSAPDPSSNHNEACAKRQATTGDWFIQSNNFAKWKGDSNSLLWLQGIPGCGKTILCSTIIEDVLLESPLMVKKAVAYFYFDFGNIESQYGGMIRSLIRQLAAQCTSQPNPLESLYSSCGNGFRQPRLCDLKQTLCDLVQKFDDTFVIIDALDECKERQQLLNDIQVFVEWQIGGLHILVTSRREWDIKTTLDRFVNEDQNIDIQNEVVDRDIRVYVRKIMQTAQGLSRWRKVPKVQDEIEKALTDNANGMFRWVVCQIDELKKCLNLPMLRQQLKTLPATLPQTYERVLLNIDKSYSRYALKILQWLTYSKYPLSLSELAEVVAIDEDEDPRFNPERRFPEPEDILLMCSSLVTTTEEEDFIWRGVSTYPRMGRVVKVKLAHFSVKEYLVSTQIMDGSARKYSIQEVDANVCIARDCLSYMLYFTKESPKPAMREIRKDRWEYPLISYAASEWTEHARVGGKINEEFVVDLIMELFTSGETACSMWLFLDAIWALAWPNELPLYYASRNNLLGVARRLITMGVDVNAHSGYYGNALCVASAYGNTEIVKLLLETMLISSGVDVNLEGITTTALNLAAANGYVEVARLLVDAGAGPYSKNAALYIACRRGHNEVVKLLLGVGVNPNRRWRAASPLKQAVEMGYHTTVKILLDAGADVNLGGSWRDDCFKKMVPLGDRQEVLELLVAAGAKITGTEVMTGEFGRFKIRRGTRALREDRARWRFDLGLITD